MKYCREPTILYGHPLTVDTIMEISERMQGLHFYAEFTILKNTQQWKPLYSMYLTLLSSTARVYANKMQDLIGA